MDSSRDAHPAGGISRASLLVEAIEVSSGYTVCGLTVTATASGGRPPWPASCVLIGGWVAYQYTPMGRRSFAVVDNIVVKLLFGSRS